VLPDLQTRIKPLQRSNRQSQMVAGLLSAASRESAIRVIGHAVAQGPDAFDAEWPVYVIYLMR